MPTLKYINPLVLVADASRAQFFCLNESGRGLTEVATLVNSAGRANEQDLSSDRQGRSFDSHGKGRHAMEAKTSAKEHAMQDFARQVTAELPVQLAGADVRNLVIIAAPKFLGVLRKALSDELRAALYLEIDADFTTHTPDQIAEAITAKLA